VKKIMCRTFAVKNNFERAEEIRISYAVNFV